MRYTRRKARNGVAVQLQAIKLEPDSFQLEIRVEMPDNDKGGVALVHDSNVRRYVRAIQRKDGYAADAGRFREWNDTMGAYYINYACNGCTGVWYDAKGRCTQKKIDAAVERIAHICGKIRLTS